jgi:hypothetical protein
MRAARIPVRLGDERLGGTAIGAEMSLDSALRNLPAVEQG